MSDYGYLALRNAEKATPSVQPPNGKAQSLYRPPTNGTTSSHGSGANKRTSMSSFPTSRPLSQSSHQSKASQSHISPPPEPSQLSNSSSAPSAQDSTKTPSSNASPHSSLLPAQEANLSAHSQRKLRSQYPRGDTEQHVEYILVASFDIDRGPIMEHQYPVAITGDEHMLAELMLPDQAHVRNQDWTIFFLHKDTSQEEEEAELKAERRRQRQRRRDIANGLIEPEEGDEDDEEHASDAESDTSSESESEGGQGPPLIYVLNLVNTKQDKTAKRGAVVRAMAICTRHPFLHIYKPLLLLALEEYFKAPHPSTLVTLYDAVNNMDLSLMPKLSLLERHLLQSSSNPDLFVEKFESMIQLRMAEDRGEKVSSKSQSQSIYPSAAGSGGRPPLNRTGTKAAIMQVVSSEYSVPRDTHEFETRVVYNGIPVPIKVPVAISPETVGDFSLIKLIQTFNDTHAKSPQPFALHQHLTTSGPLTHPIIVLVNAMLTQKRVIFLGHNRPSGEVAEAVLAACALASGGILRGFTRHAFPYTDLSKIDDLLKVPGFIAGVTNPTFENHHEWWDVLCDIPSGRIKISSRIAPAEITEQMLHFQSQPQSQYSFSTGSSNNNHSVVDPTGDNAFMAEILSSIAHRHGEGVVRSKWRQWVERFTRIAAAFEESVFGASALIYLGGEGGDQLRTGINGHGYVWSDDKAKHRELAGNAARIIGWRNTRSYYSFIQDTAQLYGYKPVKSIDLHHLHDRLQNGKLSEAGSAEVYNAFSANIQTYDEICQLLTVCPESRCGLFYIALGLFHKDIEVRKKVIVLLGRIAEHEAGRHWWKGVSRFEKLAFARIKREIEVQSKRLSDAEMQSKKSPFIGLRES